MPTLDDPHATADLVEREVHAGRRDGADTRTVVARRRYATDRADLWDALTDPDRLPRWFAPVSGDLVEGGSYAIDGNASGTIEHCDEPSSFRVTWEYGGMPSWLEVRLLDDGDGTVLELVHESPVDPDFWEQFGPGASGVGWDLAFMGLGLHLEAPDEERDQATADSFTLQPDGRAFVERAAAGWADAAVADADERADADAAARRTVEFYTTEPDETG